MAAALLALSLCLPADPANAEDGASADVLADRMLAALGGREAWAGLRNTVNGSRQNRAGVPTVVYTEITMDFENPRFRIESTGPDIHVVRVINGVDSWRQRLSGSIEDVPDELFEDEIRWYGAHLYRTIHRVAARDSSITVGLGSEGRLQVFENSERIMWFRLDADGEPYAFGTYDDDVGSLLGPWTFEEGGIRHPAWVSNPDGTWRAAVRSLSVNVPLHDRMFSRPN